MLLKYVSRATVRSSFLEIIKWVYKDYLFKVQNIHYNNLQPTPKTKENVCTVHIFLLNNKNVKRNVHASNFNIVAIYSKRK